MLDTSLCDDLVDYYNKSGEYKQKGVVSGGLKPDSKTSTDVTIFPNSTDKTIVTYLEFLNQALRSYKETYDSFMYPVCFTEGINIQYYEPGEGFPKWHCERGMHQSNQRALAFMTYLNDVTDGGETEWLHQEKKLKPKKGLTAEIRAAVWYSNCKVDDVKSIPPLNDKDTATYPGLCAGATHSSVLLDIHTDSDEI